MVALLIENHANPRQESKGPQRAFRADHRSATLRQSPPRVDADIDAV